MKTVMQKAIEKVKDYPFIYTEDSIIGILTELLEAEKEQIMKAYDAGHLDGYELGKYNEDEIYPESSYYQQTYNQEP